MDYAEEMLEGLPHYKLYDKFNENNNINGYSNYCNLMKNEDSRYTGSFELCLKFAKNLVNLSTILENEKENTDRCRYFHFWIYDEIRKKFPQYKDNIYKESFIRKFFSASSMINSSKLNNNCDFEYNNLISLDLWKQWKDIYDYFKNYDNIKNSISSVNNKCQTYHEYMQYIKKIYENYKRECCVSDVPKCPYNLNFDKWCSESSRLNELPCNTAVHTPQPYVDTAVKEVSGEQSNQLHSPTENDSNDFQDNRAHFKIGIPITLSLAGSFLVAFFSYKLTPIGSWLRNVAYRNKSFGYNISEETMNESLDNFSEYTDTNTTNNLYNIAYNPE
ncbi:PIR Superfamily Protein [Plasmodium ovale curtisi]|uniref:PIR Superfamily Protein n=2 Tax=Plasmodium ovale curtisi TaxID=864141 RepID=A0A1A8WCU8_PLAOA|nr:PIR Superfamily Protein [Plasmodium ovale curtisi]